MTQILPYAQPGRAFIIAEAGVNHDGDIQRAKRLIDVAAEAQADAVKFQTWRPGEITGRFAYKVNYLEATTEQAESRYELSCRLALPYPVFRELKSHCEARGILFLSTPDGFDSLAFLVGELDMPIVKIGSTEVTHPQYLEAIGRTGRPAILSTGLSTLGEVEKAVAALRRGGVGPLALLHCTSEYPAPDSQMNLRAMTTLGRAFGLPVGLSDHSLGGEAALAAIALGAVIIEKHFTLDRSLPGPDHQASLDPQGLAAFVAAIRRVEAMLGDQIKRPTATELANMNGIRRGVVAARNLAAGTILDTTMLVCKRPGGGIEPEDLDRLAGFTLRRDLAEDEPLSWDDVK
ncbi:N-acetylneuraminate synthase [Paramagnetospirillum magnetotacticum MS-1]|uniref:N-acetylneuraminate synthase n=1 Tax=Paramagnetospirillum magnetotacticum MS-1 TaxID=272627 RepID=A0A0C2YDH3_PARME|nr:N-acetylneuraminate synthase [Paramagnetospirillum magnetotacticum]KIL97764.1 N-acetylneuraminate synthase [Paramagnetospirillum magnetotacticum MS-1]